MKNSKQGNRIRQRRYALRNPEKIAEKNRNYRLKNINKPKKFYPRNWSNYQDKYRFGGIRNIILERDNWQCQKCGMTNEQHIILFARSITIDHIDGNGRYSDNPNNNPNNLVTLCLRCHGSKEGKLGGRSKYNQLKGALNS